MNHTVIKAGNTIIRSNKLIEARYRLSLNEQRLMMSVISLIEPKDHEFRYYRIYTKELIKILELKNKNFYSDIQLLARWLTKKTIEIKKWDNHFLMVNWVSSAEFYSKKWYIEIGIDPKLKPYLLNLKKNFLSYNLWLSINFKSYYTIRFFDLLLMNYRKYNKKKDTFIFEIAYLRKILWIWDSTYKLYADFKKRVIDTAQAELEEKSKDFFFKYSEIKEWRKTDKIRFQIISSKKQQNKYLDLAVLKDITDRINGEKLQKFIDKYSFKTVALNYEYFKRELKRWKIKNTKNPSWFLIQAIKKNYAGKLPDRKNILKKHNGNKEEKEYLLRKRKKEFKAHLKSLFKNKYKSLATDKKKAFELDFINYLKNTSHLKPIFEKKYKDSWIKDTFIEFYQFHRKNILSKNDLDFNLWNQTQSLF